MGLDFDKSGDAFVLLITQHLKAKHLKEAIRRSSYSTPTAGGIQRASLGSYFLTLTLFYPAFRAIKLYSRPAWQREDITDENVKHRLLDILKDEGGNGQYSFKWSLLKELAWAMLPTDGFDGNKACDINQLIFAPNTEYNNNDTETLIGKIKDSLTPICKMQLEDTATGKAPLGYLDNTKVVPGNTTSATSSPSSKNNWWRIFQ
jgi:hypothetical protein